MVPATRRNLYCDQTSTFAISHCDNFDNSRILYCAVHAPTYRGKNHRRMSCAVARRICYVLITFLTLLFDVLALARSESVEFSEVVSMPTQWLDCQINANQVQPLDAGILKTLISLYNSFLLVRGIACAPDISRSHPYIVQISCSGVPLCEPKL